MAKEMEIPLTIEQESVIRGHSKNEYPNDLAYIIKVAEICQATEHSRWSRGTKKEAAKDWKEVESILIEEGIDARFISLASNSYGINQFNKEKITEGIIL